MARGVGSLTVSVNANTAKAIKNLKDFQSEAKQTAQAAKQMAAEFRGSTIADFTKRFSKDLPAGAKAASRGINDFRSAVVDLRSDVSRYSGMRFDRVLARDAAALGALSRAGRGLRMLGRATATAGAIVGAGAAAYSVLSGVRTREEIGTDLGRSLGILHAEGQRPDEIFGRALDAKIEKATARFRAMAAMRAEARALQVDLTRQLAVKMYGEDFILRAEELKKFGPIVAQQAFDARKRLAELEEIERKKDEKERADEQAARERERKHKEDMRKKAEEAREMREKSRRDDEAIQGIRNRIEDFGKSDLVRERDELLRTVGPEKRAAVRWQFQDLMRLQNAADLRESLRTNFVKAQDPNSREGSAQRVRSLAQSTGNELQRKQLTHLDRIDRNMQRMAEEPPIRLQPLGLGRG